MHKITHNQKIISIPEKWEELSAKGLCKIAPFYLSGHISKAKMLLIEHHFPKKQLKSIRNEFEFLEDIAIPVGLDKIRWLKENSLHFLDSTESALNKQIFRYYKGLVGCKDSLDDVSLIRYIEAQKYFREFSKEKRGEALDKFIACLFLPKGKKKEDFDQDLPHLPKIAKLDTNFKLANIIFWVSCQKEIQEYYPYCFPDEEEKKESGDWADTLFYLAETRIFGDLEKVGNETTVHNAFAFLNKKNKEFYLQKQKQKNEEN